MNSSLTVNWQGKVGQRGLTETAIELMRGLSDKIKKPNLIDEAEKLEKEYFGAIKNTKFFNFQQELDIVSKYIKVRI